MLIGTRKTKSIWARLLVIVLFASVLQLNGWGHVKAVYGKAELSDIDASYAKSEIEELVEAGIISGYEDGSFAPANPITRAELAKIIAAMLGLEPKPANAAHFTDVAEDSWYIGYIGALVDAGITQGTSESAFSPDGYVTREEMIVFFIRAFGLEQKALQWKSDVKWSDAERISKWAKAFADFGYRIGFVRGIANPDGSLRFDPGERAERQAVARLAFEFIANQNAYLKQAEAIAAVKPSASPSSTPAPGLLSEPTTVPSPASTPTSTPTVAPTPTVTPETTASPSSSPTPEPTATPSASPLDIVHNGQANASIVVASDADDRILAAANTLAEYVQKSTGALLSIVTEEQLSGSNGQLQDQVQIHIGSSGSQPDSHLDGLLQDVEGDGFVIHFHDNGIVIAGSSVWGTQYGVFDFLERYVGVRWLMPGPDGEDVPQQSDIRIPQREIREEPAFASRVFSPIHTPVTPERPYPLQSVWAERNRMHLQIEFHHNLALLFPPSKYRNSHPEFYPNGVVPEDNADVGWQPCFTEPGTVTEAIYNIVQYFNEKPDKTSYSLGINDGNGFCEANPSHPNYPDKLNSVGLVDMSNIYYSWVNQVVAGVLQVHPDKWFGLLAYENVTDPPEGMKLNPRVVPLITKDRMAWADPDIREAGQSQMEAWSLVADHLGWYDYNYGAPYTLPRMYTSLMAENYRFAKDHGVIAHYSELYPNWGEGPKAWISAKLQWNPDLNEHELLQEWADRAVGAAAAPDLIAYYRHWEQFWTDRVQQSPWFQVNKMLTYFYFDTASYLKLVTEAEIAESRSLLQSVAAKAVTDQQKARANMLLRAFEYYEASALSYPKDVLPPADAQAALNMLEDVVQHANDKLVAAERRYALVDEFKNDPILVHQIDPRSFDLRWSGWNPHLFWRLSEYVRQHEPAGGTVTARLSELTQTGETAKMREYGKLLLTSSEGTFPVNDNPSFEFGTGTDALSWVYWIRASGSIKRTTELAHSGQSSLVISGLDRGGPAEMIAVKPGLFAARAYYYTPPGSQTDGSIQFGINMIDADGNVLSAQKFDVEALKNTMGAWASLYQLLDVPTEINGKEVKTLQIVLIVNNLTDGTKLYIDDVETYQAPDGLNFENTFWSRVDLLTGNDPRSEAMRQEMEAAAQNPEPNEERDFARLLLEITGGTAISSPANDSFESGTNTTPPWAYWVHSTGNMQRDTSQSYSGQASLKLNGLYRGGPFQTFDVKPGGFASRVHYKPGSGSTSGGTVQLSLNLLDEQGNVLSSLRSAVRPILANPGTWSSVDWVGTIPDQVNNTAVVQGQFVVVVDNLGDGNSLYVDDAVFYQRLGGWDLLNTFWKRVDYLAQSGAGSMEMQQKLTLLAQSPEISEERDYAHLLLEIAGGTALALAANDSFEAQTGATLSTWALWVQSIGVLQRSTTVFHTGQASLRMNDLDRGGPFQAFDVNHGAFASRVYYYAEPGSASGGTVQLSLNLLDAQGNVLSTLRSESSPITANPGAWASVDWTGMIPAEVNNTAVVQGQFVVVVDNLGDGNTLYVDDAVFYQRLGG
ncbi:DUF4838 domain-containing protein [Paenibacillus contaminans]|nr:DUF4838 domain-containing protein [Paenibacillus contaminans]